MTNGNLNYHFVSKTASHYNICVAAHLGLALFSSIFDPDMSSAIAVLGIISVVNASVPLLFLYLIFAPASILVDIIRLATVKHVVAFGFLIVLRICSMIVRGAAVFFGYNVYTAAAAGESQGGYEQINQGPPSQPPQSFQPPDPFNPSAYTAPSTDPAAPTS